MCGWAGKDVCVWMSQCVCVCVVESPKAPKISFSQKQNEYDEIKLHEFLSCVRKLKLCIDFSFHIFAFKW